MAERPDIKNRGTISTAPSCRNNRGRRHRKGMLSMPTGVYPRPPRPVREWACRTCGELKPASDYYVYTNAYATPARRCIECLKLAARKRQEAHRRADGVSPRPPAQSHNELCAKARVRNARPATREASRQRYLANREARVWSGKLKLYGLTRMDYDRLLEAQGGGCGICRGPARAGRGDHFYVDHDHVTGQVRGLLCNPCNRGIGWLGDDPGRLVGAIAYLQKVRA